MKYKFILAFASILIPVIYSQSIYSSEKPMEENNVDDNVSKQKEIIKKHIKGESFIQGGVKYTIYPDLVASFKKNDLENKASQSYAEANLVTKTKNFTVYKLSENTADKKRSYNNQIVYNNNSENFAILSGVIIVKTKNNNEFTEKSFEIVKSYPNMGYYLIKIPRNTSIVNTIDKIKKLNYVSEVSVEIIENFKETL